MLKMVTDPVSGFRYPDAWTERCTPDLLPLAESGFGVLTASGAVLRRGFTTGTTAAAAVYAACASLSGAVITKSPILLPCGIEAAVPSRGKDGKGCSRKYSGDYPEDITSGIIIEAEAVPSSAIELHAGFGIGRFVRNTPRYKEGEPAISPSAMQTILHAAETGCKAAGVFGASITLSIPDGERIGALTLNPKIGVAGGISVVGTTGFVEPWDDHLSETMEERISAAERVVITTGRIGLRHSRLLFPAHEAVLAGSKLTAALSAAQSCKDVVLCGLPGLILRHFNADVATSRGFATVEELLASPAGDAALLEEMQAICRAYPHLRVCIINREGTIIGDTQ